MSLSPFQLVCDLDITLHSAAKLRPERLVLTLARRRAPLLPLRRRPSHPSPALTTRPMSTPTWPPPPPPTPHKQPLVAVIGTTGVGKSQLGIDLARWLARAAPGRGAEPPGSGWPRAGEVINADSMQVYDGLDVITNKVTEEEKRGVEHHLMGFLKPGEEYKVGDFQRDAIDKVSGKVGVVAAAALADKRARCDMPQAMPST